MSGGFDTYEYFEYLVRRWRAWAVTCGMAVTLALVVSLLLPKRYTATASVLMDPPAGSDLRTATAVSPVYLESLRTYEHFADGDSLFQRAAERFHLLDSEPGASLEGRKRRILQISKPRDTRILQIAVTVGDPRTAQAVAQYLAEETVKMSEQVRQDAGSELVDDARSQMEGARRRLDAAQKAWREFSRSAATDALRAEIEALADVSAQVQRSAIAAGADTAEWSERVNSLSAAGRNTDPGQAERARRELQATRARAAALETRSRAVASELQAKGGQLARQLAQRDQVEDGVREAAASFDTARRRWLETRVAAGYRGERLKVIDPGVVPQRPSFPNIPLNIVAALLAAVVASVVHLSIAFSYGRRKETEWRETPVHADR